jgi:hypothetical protein
MSTWTETSLLPVLVLAGIVVLLVIPTMILLVLSCKWQSEDNLLKSPIDRLFIFLILVAVFMLGAFVMSLFCI